MSKYRVLWGCTDNYVDVTSVLFQKYPGEFVIPLSDIARVMYFGDHIFGRVKNIKLVDVYDNTKFFYLLDKQDLPITTYEDGVTIGMNNYRCPSRVLDNIQKSLYFVCDVPNNNHNIYFEYPEQWLAVQYLKPENKVLEIGANVGRNSLIISSILNDDRNFVSLETDPVIYNVLCKNREINNKRFHVENRALSLSPLIQKDWSCVPYVEGTLIPFGYTRVNTITLSELFMKYNIQFDTLVLDCEGAFYYILVDFPNILDNIKTIIVENDYTNENHHKYVENVILSKGFRSVFNYGGGTYYQMNCFYQVFIR